MYRLSVSSGLSAKYRKGWFTGECSLRICQITHNEHVHCPLTGKLSWFQHSTWKDFLSDGSFQEAIGSVLAMAQFFGVMPVLGVKSKTASKLQFKWFAFRTIYSLVVFFFVSLYGGLAVWFAFKNGLKFDTIGMTSFEIRI